MDGIQAKICNEVFKIVSFQKFQVSRLVYTIFFKITLQKWTFRANYCWKLRFCLLLTKIFPKIPFFSISFPQEFGRKRRNIYPWTQNKLALLWRWHDPEWEIGAISSYVMWKKANYSKYVFVFLFNFFFLWLLFRLPRIRLKDHLFWKCFLLFN